MGTNAGFVAAVEKESKKGKSSSNGKSDDQFPEVRCPTDPPVKVDCLRQVSICSANGASRCVLRFAKARGKKTMTRISTQSADVMSERERRAGTDR